MYKSSAPLAGVAGLILGGSILLCLAYEVSSDSNRSSIPSPFLPADVLYEAFGRWYLVSRRGTCSVIEIQKHPEADEDIAIWTFPEFYGMPIRFVRDISNAYWVQDDHRMYYILYKSDDLLVMERGQQALILSRRPVPPEAELEVIRKTLTAPSRHFAATQREEFLSACQNYTDGYSTEADQSTSSSPTQDE